MSTAGEARPDVGGEARNLLHALRALVAGGTALFAAELRRAGLSLGLMLAIGIALAVLAVSVWLLLMAALVVFALNAGAPLVPSLVVCALANGAAVVGCVLAMRGLSRNLGFEATRRAMARPVEEDDARMPDPA